MNSFTDIHRIPLVSSERFCAEYLSPMRPVIVSGGIAGWPAVERWTDSYLREQAGSALVIVRPRADYALEGSTRETESKTELKLDSVLSFLSSDRPPELCY